MTSQSEAIRNRIEEDIVIRNLESGAKLGSERELAEVYGVSRSTLRLVLAALEEVGRVKRVKGRAGGIFVADGKVERDLNGITGVPTYLANQGFSAGSRILGTEIAAPSQRVATALRLSAHEFVVVIRRVRLADGVPLSLEEAQLPATRFVGLLEQPLGGSIYDLLRTEYGVVPCAADEQIEAAPASDDEAAFLGVEVGAPLLLIRRVTDDEHGMPFEYSRDLFRGDRTRVRVASKYLNTDGSSAGIREQRDARIELRGITG